MNKIIIDSSKITVVSASESHSKDIWAWRNDPLTRSNSRNTELVPWESHKKWFSNYLVTRRSQMYICIDDSGHKLCMVRFDKLVDNDKNCEYEISINLNPKYRGQRLSSTLVDLAICHFVKQKDGQVTGILAEIKPSNIASIKCFGRASFEQLRSEVNSEEDNKKVNGQEKCNRYYRRISQC